MSGTCRNCGVWLDDLERATAPFGLCFDCSEQSSTETPQGGEDGA